MYFFKINGSHKRKKYQEKLSFIFKPRNTIESDPQRNYADYLFSTYAKFFERLTN